MAVSGTSLGKCLSGQERQEEMFGGPLHGLLLVQHIPQANLEAMVYEIMNDFSYHELYQLETQD